MIQVLNKNEIKHIGRSSNWADLCQISCNSDDAPIFAALFYDLVSCFLLCLRIVSQHRALVYTGCMSMVAGRFGPSCWPQLFRLEVISVQQLKSFRSNCFKILLYMTSKGLKIWLLCFQDRKNTRMSTSASHNVMSCEVALGPRLSDIVWLPDEYSLISIATSRWNADINH